MEFHNTELLGVVEFHQHEVVLQNNIKYSD